MMKKVQDALAKRQKGEGGFTLVELLVVIIIIGILAAVAIPLYLNQQNKAKDSAARSDLANLRVAVASALSENPTSGVTWADTTGPNQVEFNAGSEIYTAAVSDGVTLQGGSVDANATTFTLTVESATGATFTTNETGLVTETDAP